MKKSAELRKQAAEKVKAAGELLSTAGDAGLSDEQKVAFDALHADAKRLNDQADILDQQEKAEAAFSQSTGGPPAGANVPVTVTERFEQDPMRGFRNSRDFLLQVIQAGRGLSVTPQLRSLSRAALTVGSDEHSTTSDAHGGFFIPEAMLPGVRMTDFEGDPTIGRVTAIPMGSPTVRFAARVDKDHSTSVSGGFRVYRRSETSTVTASRGSFDMISLSADELMGISYATDELLNYSPESFAAVIDAGFRSEFPSKIIDEKLNGTGVGQYAGVLSTTTNPSLITVAKATNQPAATIVYANLVAMLSRIWRKPSAMWMINADLIEQLMLMTNPAGQLIWQPSAVEGQPDRLLGLPIAECESCSALGTLGDIILANWSEYLEGTLSPIQNASSIHVRFLEGETAFKFWTANAGAPWWRSALTPKNGKTRSPFVTLAARA